MKKVKLSNQEVKGTSDWLPAEFSVRHYIFETWRRVCSSYGFQEYLTPLVESAEIYRVKSGEDVGGKELVIFTDLGGRELCIRPEMTPSVTRLVSKIYASSPKPIKLFSIANFMRNEKPQRGRNREFWQLNCDIFGSASLAADLEILQLSLDIMKAFGAPENSFTLRLNSRRLLDNFLPIFGLDLKNKSIVFRILDKYGKLSQDEFIRRLVAVGAKEQSAKSLEAFMAGTEKNLFLKALAENSDLRAAKQEIDFVLKQLQNLGYNQAQFDPTLIRGFDYYDGLVFEVFDNHPDNRRALFGGGRYNGLAELFGTESFPAVGVAPGDETTRLFLESWNLLPVIPDERYYLPLLSADLLSDTQRLAQILRAEGKNVLFAFEPQRPGKALEFANKQGIDRVVIFGSNEKALGQYKIKEMKSGEEKIYYFKA
ncbi:MAG TPA: histidine--tRNA ligase [bacterium]|jgi:histidyl-tRNA synthetase|nr:histidine--tRNA ligase [bacterium]HQO11265.1 histidine--tRNA ligase [bacterium]HQQ38198.1 histidine--tRNA ligase [bacterium]